MRSHIFIKQTVAQLSLFLIVFSAFSGSAAFAQKTSTAAKSSAAPKCASGAWTGVITYGRFQTMTNNKTEQRVSGRGQDTTSFNMTYNYNAKVAVMESPENNSSSRGLATIDSNMNSTEVVEAKESNSCDRGKTWKVMSGTSTSMTNTTGSDKGEANVSVGVDDDGTYTVSVGLPQIKGKSSGETKSSFSGQCTPKEGKSHSLPPTDTTIDGNSLTTDRSHRVDPADPTRLSGSYSKTWQNVTETLTWSLRKCGGPLQLVDLKFEHPKYPDFANWQEITEQTSTIDGNMVKIKAKVINASADTRSAVLKLKETYKGDRWDGAKPDAPLKDTELDVSLDPGEEKEVEMVWDSSGYAWYDDGRPRLVQRIKAELEEKGKKVDEKTENLKVAPKPLVLVHGLWSNWKAWETWQNILTTSHSYDWKAFPVGEKADKGIMNTGGAFLSTDPTNSIFENSQQLGNYIKYAQEDRNAWHVDLVGHSMGGLISRHYIHHFMTNQMPDGRPQVSKLVMLGTPNQGSPCADLMDTGFGMFGKNVEAVRELQTDIAAKFNQTVKNRKGVKMSVLAGNPIPTICYSTEWNDGVVTVPSAVHNFTDTKTSKSVHTDLTGTKDFSDFVKPRLAIGPKGDHNPDTSQYTGQAGDELYRSQNPFTNVAYNHAAVKPEIFFGKGTAIAANQTVEIEIPVPANTDGFGLTFMASPLVSATLVDAQGNVLGKNVKDTIEARSMFRSIIVPKDLSGTTIKLRLKSEEKLEATAIVSVWKRKP